MLERIDIYWFSGTGNTLLAVREMAEVFRGRGSEVRLFRMEASDPAAVDVSRTVGLAFPVAAQSTYPLVWDFLDLLPPGRSAPVFMVDTLVAFSGGMVGPLRKLLVRKGYRPLGAREIRMPNNFLPGKIRPEKNEAKRVAGREEARRFAASLFEGTARWVRVPVLSDLLCLLSRSRFTARYLNRRGEKFRVSAADCTGCGLCVRLCPVGNIAPGKPPSFAGRCQQCMRCISFCPTGAITVPGKKYEVYRAIRAGELAPSGAGGGGG